MPHLPGFFVDNFRVFSSPVLFNFSPINILTGPNNSGKSSLIKAILLLKENFSGNGFPSQIQFKDESHRLGSFEFVLNNPETPHIQLGFPIRWVAPLISEDVEDEQWMVSLKYEKAKESQNKNPLLVCLKIWERNSGVVLLEINYQNNEVLMHDDIGGSKPITNSKINSELLCKISEWFSFDRGKGLSSQFARKLIIHDYLINVGALAKPTPDFFKEESYGSAKFNGFSEGLTYFESQKIELNDKPILKYVKKDKEIPFSDDEINEIIRIEEQAFKNLACGKSSFQGNEEFIRLLSQRLDPIGFFYFSNYCYTNDSNNFKFYQRDNFTVSGENAPLVFEFIFYEVLYLLWKSNFNHIVSLDPKLYNQRVYLDSRERAVPDQLVKMEKFLDDLVSYFKNFIVSVSENTSYVPSHRVSQSRIYSKTNEANILANLLGKVDDLNIEPSSIEFHFLRYWIENLELGEDLFVETIEGTNARIIVKRNGKSFNIADLGYGSAQIISVLLQIIIHARHGYGTFEHLSFFDKSVMLIEEPEANLHPKLQSKLAEMFIDAANRFNIQFIIETHSEYFIRKMQYLTANKGHNYNIKPKNIAIFYFNDPKTIKEGETQTRRINIREDGILDGSFGPGFFDETSNLIKEIFKLSGAN